MVIRVEKEKRRQLYTFLTHVDCQSLVNCRAASRRDAISVTPYVVWGMRITNIYDGCRCPTLRYARIG